MSQCPECGTEVPSEGKFCPECGAQLGAGTARGSSGGTGNETGGRTDRQPRGSGAGNRRPPGETEQEWEYPRGSAGARPEDHKLLLGGVGVLSALGLVQGLFNALSPATLASEVVAATADAGMEIEQSFAEQIVVVTGVIGVVVALVALGLTAKYYSDGVLPRRYFWGLIGAGVAGFLLANNLLLTVLVAFGIYGLVSVTR